MPTISPNELKALTIYYGSDEKARKAIGIGKATLVDARNADMPYTKGGSNKKYGYKLKPETADKVSKAIFNLPQHAQNEIKKYTKALDATNDSPPVKLAFMNSKPEQRKESLDKFAKYTNDFRRKKFADPKAKFWQVMMSKLYEKNNWKLGRFGGKSK